MLGFCFTMVRRLEMRQARPNCEFPTHNSHAGVTRSNRRKWLDYRNSRLHSGYRELQFESQKLYDPRLSQLRMRTHLISRRRFLYAREITILIVATM